MYATRLLVDHDGTADHALSPGAARMPRAQILDDLYVDTLARDGITEMLRHEWRALGQDAADPNPFFLIWFLDAALSHLPDAADVQLCTVRRKADGRLVGLLPVTLGDSYAKLPLRHISVWQHPHGYNGTPLIRRGFEPAVYAALMRWIDTRPHGARFLRFTQLPCDETGGFALAGACHTLGRDYRIQSWHERAILSAGQDFDAVMKAAMTGKKRKELRRQANRFADLGAAEFVELQVDAAAIEAFLRIENEGWKSTAPGGMPLARSAGEAAFFHDAMLAGAREDAVTCTALMLDGDPKAMLFNLRAGGRLSAFKTSYDEAYRAYSPGVRLLIEATRRMLGCHGVCIFDSCARQDHPVVDGLWPERLAIAQVNVAAANPVDRALLAIAASAESVKQRAGVWIRKDTPGKEGKER